VGISGGASGKIQSAASDIVPRAREIGIAARVFEVAEEIFRITEELCEAAERISGLTERVFETSERVLARAAGVQILHGFGKSQTAGKKPRRDAVEELFKSKRGGAEVAERGAEWVGKEAEVAGFLTQDWKSSVRLKSCGLVCSVFREEKIRSETLLQRSGARRPQPLCEVPSNEKKAVAL
jgi:hypothetical protein